MPTLIERLPESSGKLGKGGVPDMISALRLKGSIRLRAFQLLFIGGETKPSDAKGKVFCRYREIPLGDQPTTSNNRRFRGLFHHVIQILLFSTTKGSPHMPLCHQRPSVKHGKVLNRVLFDFASCHAYADS